MRRASGAKSMRTSRVFPGPDRRSSNENWKENERKSVTTRYIFGTMKQSTALWITNRTKELGRPFAIIVQTARCQVSSSTRPQYEQRTWILFSGNCEKKSAGNQLQAVLYWGTGILVLSVAAYTCASEPGPQTQRSFRKEGSCPQLVQLTPPTWSLGEFPVASRPLASQMVANIFPTLVRFLCLGSPWYSLIHSLPSADNHSSVPWCTTAWPETATQPLGRLHDSPRLQHKLFL